MRRLLGVAALCAALAGCGATVGSDGPVDPDQPVATAVPPGGAGTGGPGGGAQLVEPRPGMVDVHAVPWETATVEGDTVTVSWWSGVEPCAVLDHVEVEETESTVTITLFEGREPADEPVACIEIAQQKRTVVELDAPVGRRDLVDGAEA